MDKKAQIAIFLIVGVIVLVMGSVVMFYLSSGKTTGIEVKEQEQQVSADIIPIKGYVESCLRTVGQEGLIQMGRNGGYLDYTYMKKNGRQASITEISYQSDGINIDPDYLPYWNYLNKQNRFDSWMPPLTELDGPNSEEAQLKYYINAKLKDCINDFESFSNQYNIIQGKVDSKVIITNKDVVVTLKYPLNIEDKSTLSKTKMQSFSNNLQINYKEIYQFAQEITTNEAKYNFLEQSTLNIISAYAGEESNLPPLHGPLIMGKSSKQWNSIEVEQIIKNDVLDYTRAVQIINSLNYKPYESDDEIIRGFHSSLTYMLRTKNYNLSANFLYPDKPIYFNMGNKILRAKSLIPSYLFIFKLIPFLDIQRFNYRYDLSYPVVVRVGDPFAFNNKGFELNFALESNIRNSVPVSHDFIIPSSFSTPLISIDNPDQLLNKTINITVKNRYTKSNLSGVEINYACGSEVYIGSTGSNGVLNTKFPYCMYGGRVIASKEGFASSTLIFDNNNDDNALVNLNLELWPKVNRTILIKKRTLDDINKIAMVKNVPLEEFGKMLKNSSRDLSKYDKVFLMISKDIGVYEDTPVPMIGFVKFEGNTSTTMYTSSLKEKMISSIPTSISEEDKKLFMKALEEMNTTASSQGDDSLGNVRELVPGNYTISATALDFSGVYIGRDFECNAKTVSSMVSECVSRKTKVEVPKQELIDTGINDLSHPYYFNVGRCKPKTVFGELLSGYVDLSSMPSSTINIMMTAAYKNPFGATGVISAGWASFKTYYSTSSFCDMKKIDSLFIPVWNEGGLESATVKISPDLLYKHSNITFYIIELPKPSTQEDLQKEYVLSDYQQPLYITPTYN